MTVRIVQGSRNREFFVQLRTLEQPTKRGIRRAFFLIGRDLVGTSQKLIDTGPKQGRVYRVGKSRRRHTSSAPGQAPANITRLLRRSIGYRRQGSSELVFGASARTEKGAPYAKFLERGTNKMRKRPYLFPSITRNQRNIENYFIRNIEGAFSRP